MKTNYQEAIDTAKRACSRCQAHKTFNPNEDEREIAHKAAKRAHTLLNETFNEIRKKEETTYEQIEDLKTAKRLCLDACDECKICDKDQPRIRQILVDL